MDSGAGQYICENYSQRTSYKKKAAYVYIIQLAGKDYTRKGEGVMENVTENQIVLTAIIKALMRQYEVTSQL